MDNETSGEPTTGAPSPRLIAAWAEIESLELPDWESLETAAADIQRRYGVLTDDPY